MDRASDSDSESQGFNSLHAYELLLLKNNGAVLVSTFKFCEYMIQVEVCILRKNIQTYTITAKNLIISLLTVVGSIFKVNQSNSLKFAL